MSSGGQTILGTEAGGQTEITDFDCPSCGAHDFGCAPRGALDSTRIMHDLSVHDSGHATCGSDVPALPAALLTLPSSCAGATSTASTSVVTVDEGNTGGTSGQPSSDDHADEVGLSASDRHSPSRPPRCQPCHRFPPPPTLPSLIRAGAMP
jgi:hypothetical protein